jgi:hypothetical protein
MMATFPLSDWRLVLKAATNQGVALYVMPLGNGDAILVDPDEDLAQVAKVYFDTRDKLLANPEDFKVQWEKWHPQRSQCVSKPGLTGAKFEAFYAALDHVKKCHRLDYLYNQEEKP